MENKVAITIDMPPPHSLAGDGGNGLTGEEHNPQDAWLPITESRKGNTFTVIFHLICSGIGIQLLSLPIGFISLGWLWGTVCLSVAYSWQLYSIWLLVNLHESSPPQYNGIRYSRYLHLSIVAFGEKLGKFLVIFPTMYLSGGTCVMYIIAGGSIVERLYGIMFGTDAKSLSGAEWYLVFICFAIFVALFFPNLNSVARVTLIGSITAIVYCTLLWVLSVRYKGSVSGEVKVAHTEKLDGGGFQNVLNGIGFVVLSFRGINLVLEIQGTIPSNPKEPSRKVMWRGVIISYTAIAACMYTLAIVGHWAFGDNVSVNRGMLTSFTELYQNNTSKYLNGALHIIIFINYICVFQIYAMPTLENFERLLYVSKKNKPCPRWVRASIKVFVGGLTYFVAVAMPFLPKFGALVGSIALPMTLVYPCFMWLVIKKPRRFSRIWFLNFILGSLGIVLSVLLATAALLTLVSNGLHANFFNPK